MEGFFQGFKLEVITCRPADMPRKPGRCRGDALQGSLPDLPRGPVDGTSVTVWHGRSAHWPAETAAPGDLDSSMDRRSDDPG